MSEAAAVDTVARHLVGVRNFHVETEVAPDSQWTVISGELHHAMTPSQAYRFVMQAWDFPLATSRISDAGAGRVRAELRFDNGLDCHKVVSAEYQVNEGVITKANLHDAQTVRNNG